MRHTNPRIRAHRIGRTSPKNCIAPISHRLRHFPARKWGLWRDTICSAGIRGYPYLQAIPHIPAPRCDRATIAGPAIDQEIFEFASCLLGCSQKKGPWIIPRPNKKTVGLFGAPTVRMQSVNGQPDKTAPQAHLCHHQLLKLLFRLSIVIDAILKVDRHCESSVFSNLAATR